MKTSNVVDVIVDRPFMFNLRKKQGDLIEMNNRYYLARYTYYEDRETDRSILKEVVEEGSERLIELQEKYNGNMQDRLGNE